MQSKSNYIFILDTSDITSHEIQLEKSIQVALQSKKWVKDYKYHVKINDKCR